MATTEKKENVVLPPMVLQGGGSTPAQSELNLVKVLPSPGYPFMVLFLANVFQTWAQRAILDYTSQQVNIRYQVDGIWNELPPMDRESGDYMLASMKQLANMDFRQRDERQDGKFKAQLNGRKYTVTIQCRETASGERVQLLIDLPRPEPTNLSEMGMREKALTKVKDFFKQTRGLVVSCALPGEGSSMCWKGVRSAGDRFMSDYVTYEQERMAEDEVINVGSVYYKSAEDFSKGLSTLLLKEPDAVFFSNVRNPAIMRHIVEVGLASPRLMVVQIDARSAVEALYRLQILGMTRDEIRESLVGVVAQRLVRRLCVHCREAYEPDPATLAKLGIPPGRVRGFYKQFDPAAHTTVDSKGNAVPPPPCPTCGGAGYFARLGLFEVLQNDDTVKKILQGNSTFPEAQKAWRAAGNTTFREEGVAAVALGTTSIEELQRVLKT